MLKKKERQGIKGIDQPISEKQKADMKVYDQHVKKLEKSIQEVFAFRSAFGVIHTSSGISVHQGHFHLRDWAVISLDSTRFTQIAQNTVSITA